MRKTRASSSKRPHIGESPQEEEENLSKTYKAKFLILSYAEGKKLKTIRFREILGCKYIPNSLLNNVSMLQAFDQLLNQYGFKKFVDMHEDTYVNLITEFYITLDVNERNSQVLEFRLEGKPHQLTYSFMNRVFGFKKDGLCDPPSNFKLNEFWTFLTICKPLSNIKRPKQCS